MTTKKELLWSLWEMQLLTKCVLMAPSKHWCVAGGQRLPRGTPSRMKDLWGRRTPCESVWKLVFLDCSCVGPKRDFTAAWKAGQDVAKISEVLRAFC